jgi:hypothetical protein
MSALAGNCLAAATQLLEADVHAANLEATEDEHMADVDQEAAEFIQQHNKALIEMNNASLLGALFTPQAQQYHMVIKLRHEALPKAMQALPEALGPRIKRGRQPDALSELMGEDNDDMHGPPPPKRARAFLDAFPDKAVQGRGPAALREELLVGFNPVSQLISTLKAQLLGGSEPTKAGTSTQPTATSMQDTTTTQGAVAAVAELPVLATLWSDQQGGKLLGLKWSPTGFIPSRPMVSSQVVLQCVVRIHLHFL